MDTIKAEVTPRLLSWARRRRGMGESDLAAKLNVSPETVAAWERGDVMPTFRQARRLAQRLYVPFGYLYLREPPVEEMPLADFRTVDQARPVPSPDLLDLLRDIMGKQQWLREYRESEGADELSFVGRFGTADPETAVADDIRATLDVDGARQGANGWEGLLRSLVRKAEGSGIVVMRSGVVGGNNYRPLDRGEFRGFSIPDRVAPLVFINTRDFTGAHLFTLAHEMAHIWTGQGGVSNPDYGLRSQLRDLSVERFCNRVAAETLAPSGDFLTRWRSGDTMEDNLNRLRRHYKISTMVVLRQALDSGLIAIHEYQGLYAQLAKQSRADTAGDTDGESGGNFYRTLLSRNGRPFTEAVVSSAAQGTTLSSEAADMLGVKVKSLSGIAKHLYGNGLGLG